MARALLTLHDLVAGDFRGAALGADLDDGILQDVLGQRASVSGDLLEPILPPSPSVASDLLEPILPPGPSVASDLLEPILPPGPSADLIVEVPAIAADMSPT